jgi:hypothetical protein
MFPHKAEFERVTIYSDKDIAHELIEIMSDVEARLQGLDLKFEGSKPRVFICYNQKLFNFYVRLFFQYPGIQGFGPSITNNYFLSNENILRLGAISQGLPKYIKRQGSLGHAITHEMVHHYILNSLDLWTSSSIPFWKNEGFTEYGTHINYIKNDSTTSLASRIDEMLNDHIWMGHDRAVRDAYKWELMVEYLIEIRGYKRAEIMQDSVTYAGTYSAMIDWYKDKQ